jgi:hypothetical protein
LRSALTIQAIALDDSNLRWLETCT